MKKFFQDFKAFALKGNIIDMAVGVVIGGAFGKIVTSLVTDIITPLISLATGKTNLQDLKWVLREAVMKGEEILEAEVAITYGVFIQTIIDFFIIALSIFIVLRIIMTAQKKAEELKKKKEEQIQEEAAAPAETEITLLKEIRDMMKKEEKAE